MPVGAVFLIALAVVVAGLILGRFVPPGTLLVLLVIIGVLLVIAAGSHYHAFR